MANELKRAVAQMEAEKYDRALDLMIVAWQESRATELADAIDQVDKIVPPAANERGVEIREVLTMNTAPIVRALGKMKSWNDPRVASMVIALLTELRFSGNKSQPFWRHVFTAVPALKDPRFVPLAETLPRTWSVGPSMQRWLTNHLIEVAESSAKATKKTLSPEQLTHVAQIRELAVTVLSARAQSRVGEHSGAANEATLLADVYANPNDDAARLVYADWLLEQGDARGELISLQLRPEADKDKAALKREHALLKEHRKALLGALAPAVGGDPVFRRGFLSRATLKFRHQRDVELFGSLPGWATLEEVQWSNQLVRDDQMEWTRFFGPTMCNVKIVHEPRAKFILDTTTTEKPWAIEELHLSPYDLNVKTFHEVLASPRLPNLKRVGLSGWSTLPAYLEEVPRVPEELILQLAVTDARCWEWIKSATPTAMKAIAFRDWDGTHFTFRRDKDNALRALEIDLHPRTKWRSLSTPPTKEIEALGRLLEAVPRTAFDRFSLRIEVNGQLVDTLAIRQIDRDDPWAKKQIAYTPR